MFEQAAKRTKHEMGVLMQQHKKDEENPDRKINDGKDKGSTQEEQHSGFPAQIPIPWREKPCWKSVFFPPEIIQGLEIHEEQGWDTKPVAVSALGSQEKLEKQLGKQERGSAGAAGAKDRGFRRNFCCHYSNNQFLLLPGCGNMPGQGREEKFSFPNSPKRQNPSCTAHVGKKNLLFIIYPLITFSKILTESCTGQGQSQCSLT